VVYLDFDGMLHPEGVYWSRRRGPHLGSPDRGHRLFEHAALLDTLLEPYPGVGIVLSTTWVRQYRYGGAVKRLPDRRRARCIGATFHSQMNRHAFENLPRGQQVLEDVARRQPRAWLAVDDAREGWPPFADANVVLSDPTDGIAHPLVLDSLTRKLEQQFGRA